MTEQKIIAWIRVSTTKQDHTRQINDLKQHYKEMNWTWQPELIRESKETAFITTKRHDFNKLLTEIKENKLKDITGICFWDYSRFSREGIRATLNYIHQLNQHNIKIYSYLEKYVNPEQEFSDMIIAILSWKAQMESIHTSKRVKSGMTNTINNQHKPLGKAPYGYKYHPKHNKNKKYKYYIINTTEAVIVQIYTKTTTMEQTPKK